MKTLLLPIVLEWLALHGAPAMDVEATLGAPRFRVRQHAAQHLEAAWPLSDATLRRAECSADPEVAEAAGRIRCRCRERMLVDAPWADWPLWCGERHTWDGSRWPALHRAITRRINQLPPEERALACPQYAAWSEISRRWGRDALDAGLPPSLVQLWFAIGRAVDADYRRNLVQP